MARHDFYVTPNAKTRRILALLSDERQWKLRADKAVTEFVQQVADAVAAGVRDRLPPMREWQAYRDSIQVVRVGRRGSFFAVRADPRVAGQADVVDADRTVLYVRRRKGWMGKKHPEIDVLQRFNPWTTDVLPFKPSPREARVESRRVSPREVRTVRRQRRADRLRWGAELQRLGVRMPTRQERMQDPPREAVPDLTFNALRLEFGGLGVKAVPHWRPTIYSVLSSVPKLLSGKNLRRTLLDPKFSAWRRWPRRTYAAEISVTEATEYREFQDRLNLQV